jgi:hypothetical protein
MLTQQAVLVVLLVAFLCQMGVALLVVFLSPFRTAPGMHRVAVVLASVVLVLVVAVLVAALSGNSEIASVCAKPTLCAR